MAVARARDPQSDRAIWRGSNVQEDTVLNAAKFRPGDHEFGRICVKAIC